MLSSRSINTYHVTNLKVLNVVIQRGVVSFKVTVNTSTTRECLTGCDKTCHSRIRRKKLEIAHGSGDPHTALQSFISEWCLHLLLLAAWQCAPAPRGSFSPPPRSSSPQLRWASDDLSKGVYFFKKKHSL